MVQAPAVRPMLIPFLAAKSSRRYSLPVVGKRFVPTVTGFKRDPRAYHRAQRIILEALDRP